MANTQAPHKQRAATASDADVPDWQKYTKKPSLPPVLEHALRAFVDNGYHATTVRDLAKRLGQTVPAIYYHYENKQALLVALLDLSIDDLLERCSKAEASDDPVERLSALTRCIVLFVAHRRELAFLDSEIRALEPRNRKAYVAKRDAMEAILTRAVDDGMKSRVFAPGDSHAVSRAIITMVRGIANWYRPDGALKPNDLADLYVTYSLRMAGYVEPGRR